MKTIATTLNALLIFIVLTMVASDGGPGDEWILLLAFLSAPIASLLALHRGRLGLREPQSSSEKEKLSPSQPNRPLEERKPIYEWIQTVEERLASIERAQKLASEDRGRSTGSK